MNENRDNQSLRQQLNAAHRQQVGQQNKQGETRQGEGLKETDLDQLKNGSVGGIDAGQGLQPGRTGDGGAER